MSAKKYIAKVRKDFSELKKTYEIYGSTYSLIVDITEMMLDLLRIVQKAHGTEFYNKAKKLNNEGHEFRRKLISEIERKDLLVLSKHGNTDADWIIAQQISEKKSGVFEKGNTNTRKNIWRKYMHHLERGVLVNQMIASTAQRMIFLGDRLAFGLEPDFKKAIFYFETAATLGTKIEAGEANYNLWSIYLDELNKKQKAKTHLLRAVELNYPEALAAYGRAHWGDWLVKEDERKAFSLLKKASQLGSDWGTELLALSYSQGLGTKKNNPKAFELRIGLGEDYSSELCCELGEHYLEGKGTPVNLKEANRLIKKAMKLGNGKAHWIAANELQYKYKKQDKKRFNILRAAFDLDEPYTLTFNNLASCYFWGDGTEQDFAKARECYERLLEVGSIGADEEYARFHLEALESDDPEAELDRIVSEN